MAKYEPEAVEDYLLLELKLLIGIITHLTLDQMIT